MIELVKNQKQLFLDDHVIERLDGVTRRLHQPRKYSHYPVLPGGYRWENEVVQIRGIPQWVAGESVWKVWYLACGTGDIEERGSWVSGYAVSRDGLNWEKPFLRLHQYRGSKENNIVAQGAIMGVIVHEEDRDPSRRYKGLLFQRGCWYAIFSPDGIHWSEPTPEKSIIAHDEGQVIYDDLSGKFLATVKRRGPYGRAVCITWSDDFDTWTEPELIFHADEHDQQLGRERLQQAKADASRIFPPVDVPAKYNADIYNFPVFPYEGLYIAMPCIFDQAGPLPYGNQGGFLYPELACSRDAYHWQRVAAREVFIPLGTKECFDSGMILAASRPIRKGDELWIYYSGFPNTHDKGESRVSRFPAGVGLAILRLDGFVSLDAPKGQGSILTKPLLLQGDSLRLNANAAAGEVRTEVLPAEGQTALAGFSAAESLPLRGDSRDAELRWEGKTGIRELAGRPVTLRFLLHNASLYAFWSADWSVATAANNISPPGP